MLVFDPQDLIDRATFEDPHRDSAGVRHLFVARCLFASGQLALEDGEPTGDLPGRTLRHESPPQD